MEVLTGRLTAAATVNEVKGGRQVVNFTIAINDYYKTKEGERKQTTRFVQCAYWVSPAIAPFLLKGGLVEVAGRIDVNAWNNRQGMARGVLTLQVSEIKLHGKTQPTMDTASLAAGDAASHPSEDCPF